MCKYCEDNSLEIRDGFYTYRTIKSIPHQYGSLIGVSLHYKFEKIKTQHITYVLPHFCPMCGKKIIMED